MEARIIKCPVCDCEMRRVDIPKYHMVTCGQCEEVGQVLPDGTVKLIATLLEHSELGDDRVQAAISKPHVASMASFTDIFENSTRMWQMDLASACGGLRTVLAQIENRIDFAISKFTGLDLASDDAGEGLRMLREARELVSPLAPRHRGIREEPR
jgi:hypothetical protein